MSVQLAELGVPVFAGFRAENLDWGPDKVVVGNACRRDHVEVEHALRQGAGARDLAVSAIPVRHQGTRVLKLHVVAERGDGPEPEVVGQELLRVVDRLDAPHLTQAPRIELG